MIALGGEKPVWATTSRHQIPWLNLLLVLSILLVYWQVGGHDFVNLDTPHYISENPYVNTGLSRANVIWAFTTIHGSNWHPLTWLSHMLDVEMFGLAPGPHHLVNVFFHTVNGLLLFYLLRRMTRTIWPSALTAALFALHPLHVESVAWAAERKDVLSGCFWLLTLLSYCRYVEQPRLRRYLAVLFFLALGLMAKSMLVTMPFVLLLLDYWPLNRFEDRSIGQGPPFSSLPARLIVEKMPLFLLSVISSGLTLHAQHEGGAVSSIEFFPIPDRVANSLVAYLAYLGKTIWPADLAVFYPLRTLPAWQGVAAALLLLAISFLVYRHSKSRPWLMVGWLWYLGTLVPVIGLLHVGSQAMADRYTYIPLIGIFFIIAWSLAELAAAQTRLKTAIIALTVVVLVIFTIATKVQVGYWRNSISLYDHAIASTQDNHLAHYNLAAFLAESGQIEEAMFHYAEGLKIFPTADNCYAYAVNLEKLGKNSEAERYYRMALQLNPEYEYAHEVHVNLGVILARRGLFTEATGNFMAALRLDPENVPALFSLGNVNLAQDNYEEAFRYFSEVVRLQPGFAYAFCGLGEVRVCQGLLTEALGYFTEALRLAPDDSYIIGCIEKVKNDMREAGTEVKLIQH